MAPMLTTIIDSGNRLTVSEGPAEGSESEFSKAEQGTSASSTAPLLDRLRAPKPSELHNNNNNNNCCSVFMYAIPGKTGCEQSIIGQK